MQAKNNEREQEVLLEMKGLKVSFPIHKNGFRQLTVWIFLFIREKSQEL